ILALLVRFIRQHWPATRIVFRGDAGFYRPRLLEWCDRHNVDYLVGFSKNSKLLDEVKIPMARVRHYYRQAGEKMSGVYRFQYQARSWKRSRWIVSRLE
ncbi:transposase, partial [Halospina sp. K52047b]|uniref:transposase n=1 Tax=Halospina sp. K52047b TaxID=2614160 RepID=UPI00124AA00F